MPGFTYGEEGRGSCASFAGCPRSKLEGMDKPIAGLKFVLTRNNARCKASPCPLPSALRLNRRPNFSR